MVIFVALGRRGRVNGVLRAGLGGKGVERRSSHIRAARSYSISTEVGWLLRWLRAHVARGDKGSSDIVSGPTSGEVLFD